MTTLYIDCGMGAAGDMLTAALMELFPRERQDALLRELNGIGIPGVEYIRETSVKCGVSGTHITVSVNGTEESECLHGPHLDAENRHYYAHNHHYNSDLYDIEHIFSHLQLSTAARENALAVYRMIAEAESAVHGVPVTEIHFHEVGAMDAVADVAAVCLLMDRLAPDEVVVSPVHVGSGHVHCAHGILPVPAPAAAYILRGVPIYGGRIEGELCTPTGAALLKHFAARFADMPIMSVRRIGYGMGKRDFPQANCVRALLGETEVGSDAILTLSCSVDDMTGEELGFVLELLLENGARDAYTVPIGMKKSRPGVLLCVLCRPEDRARMRALLFRHTSTLGVRESLTRRYILDRRVETAETPFGPARVKLASGYGVHRKKFEYDDLARFARENDISLAEVRERLEET